jgi:spermidine/putrescine-binding protein
MLPKLAWGAELGLKETTKFKVQWQAPKGKTFPPNTSLAYLSWEPWCRPYQVDIFNKHTGIKVTTALFKSTQEMVTKLGAGGAHSYDIFSPAQDPVKKCVEQGWFQPINRNNIPHYKYLHPAFQNNPSVFINGKDYIIPFVWGTDAVINNTEKIPVFDSYSILYNPKYKGLITMQDNAVSSIATIAIYLGYKKPFELEEKDLEKIKAEFVKIKPQIRTFWTSKSKAMAMLAGGEVWAVINAYMSMVQPLRDQGLKIEWTWPKEGTYGWFEGIAISAYSKNKEAAEIFADWCIGEEFGAVLAKDMGQYPCSTACKVNLTAEEIKRVHLDNPQLPTRTFMLEMPANIDRWQEIWSEIKAL